MLASLGLTLEDIEQIVIEERLKFYLGNKTMTAASLGISLRTVDNKLEIYAGKRTESKRVYDERAKEREEEIERTRSRFSPRAGMYVEPSVDVKSESKVSVLERKEVQEVLPRQAPQSHSKKRG